MTLVVAATSKKSIWLMTDRRLYYHGRKPKDDARKVLVLNSTDGLALLGYAGLGATAMGTEPSDWMAQVLRGRKLPLEQSLSVLAGAVQARLPRHLDSLAGVGAPAHNIIVSAFHNGEPKLYTIDLLRPRGSNAYAFRYTRIVSRQVRGEQMTPRPCRRQTMGA